MFNLKNKSFRAEFEIQYPSELIEKRVSDDPVKKVIVTLDQIKGATQKDAEMLMTAAMLMETGLNSPQFYKAVTDPKLKLEFTNGLDNCQVFNRISSGATDLEPQQDSTANLKVEIYHSRFSRTIGYTYSNTTWQWFNRRFLWPTKTGMRSLASNLLHEYCHKCGFGHQSRGYTRFNVPYYYGDTLEKVLEIIENG